MRLSSRNRSVRLVRPDNAEMSDMLFSQRYRSVRLVRPDNAEMLVMSLPQRSRTVRLVRPDNAEMLVMSLPQRYSVIKLVNPESEEMLDIVLPPRFNHVRLVKPAKGAIFDIELFRRRSHVRLVNPIKGERSDTELLLIASTPRPSAPRSNRVRLVACSSPVKLLMLALGASSRVNPAMSAVVMVAPDALPRAFSIAARRFGSGMVTGCGGSNNTSTPLPCSVGMCVLKAAAFRGFPLTSTLSSLPNPVLETNGERSDMVLLCSHRYVRLVNPDNAEISVRVAAMLLL